MARGIRKGLSQAWQRRPVSYAPYIVIGAILIILPCFLSGYMLSMVTKFLIFAIFALSLNVIWGRTGLFSLGHAAYFGVAAYTSAILTVRYGVENFWLTTTAGILMAALVAAFFGFVALRVSGVYFLFVTLALGELLYSIALKWRAVTGGSDGMVVGYPVLGLPGFTITSTSFYYLVFAFIVICYFLLYRLTNSPFGHALEGIREDEYRLKRLGYNTWLYKYIAFIIAGLFAGVAGVLMGHFTGIIVPDNLGVLTSTFVMLMVIIGSDRVFFGPVLGALVVVYLEHISSIYFPERWPLILGATFVLAIMFLRGGISIYLVKLWKRRGPSYGST